MSDKTNIPRGEKAITFSAASRAIGHLYGGATVSPRTLSRYASNGRLKFFQIGRKRHTTLAWVRECIEAQQPPLATPPRSVSTTARVEASLRRMGRGTR